MHEAMAAALNRAVEHIKKIQHNARDHGNPIRPRWPMIVLKSPKGSTGPEIVDGLQVQGTFRRTRCPFTSIGASRTPQAAGKVAEELSARGTLRREGR